MPQTPIAITMGDPAGVGPEIVVKALAGRGASRRPVVVLGERVVIEDAVRRAGVAMPVRAASELGALGRGDGIAVLETSDQGVAVPGAVARACGAAAYAAIEAGIGLARSGRVAALVTAPIHKEAFAAAGASYPGHTEMLADLGGAERVAMMLANDEIRTVLVTIHLSLRDAVAAADHAAQIAAIRLAEEGCRALGVARPRIAVAGMNPHAGEGGLFGREEIEIIAPAIAEMRAAGLDVSGPYSGDTVFMQARNGAFDVVVAQYHDQGLIPVKYLGLEKGVNITLGLPFIRTSPDHGTAFDIAGRGIADPSSLAAALETAERMVAARALGAAL